MIHHSRPTRAEASDVANATLDGADALMLSGETSVGEHAIEAVATMSRLIAAAEEQGLGDMAARGGRRVSRQEAIAASAVDIARALNARALVAFTQSGSTARSVASHREAIPLLAFTPEPAVRSQLALVWGVETFVVPRVDHTDALIAQVDRAMLELKRGAPGDLVVILAGTPPATIGTTNMLRVHRLGDI
jgi:pyruvate kinase